MSFQRASPSQAPTSASSRLPTILLGGLFAACLAGGGPAAAQDTPIAPEPEPELVTDRPDQTESPAVVPAGYVQVESGFTLTRDEEDVFETRVLEGPGTLVRVGLGHRTELRLGWAGWIEEEVETRDRRFGKRTHDGIGDGELGAKVRLRDEAGAIPETALLVGISVPVGDDELSTDRLDPAMRLSFAHTLTERLGLGYNLGVEWSSEPGAEGVRETHSRIVYTVALGTSVTERLGAFVELFGTEPVDAPEDSAVSLDGGFTYLLRPNLQLDLFAGGGLTDDAADWLAGAGVSYRWPR